jgi:hypothetical protein
MPHITQQPHHKRISTKIKVKELCEVSEQPPGTEKAPVISPTVPLALFF